MKSHLRSIIFICAVAAVRPLAADEAPAAAPAASPPPETTMIVDLSKPQQGLFQYGSWDGRVAPGKSGLSIVGAKGAQGNGGFGCDLAGPIDCQNVTFFEVALGTAPGNEVPAVTVALNDADGTQYTARINVDNLVPGQPVWVRARRDDFRLNDRERGSDGKMDWAHVTRWHLQGDWTTMKPMKLVFIALRARH